MTNSWRLGRNGRRIWLITHIVFAGSWLGVDVAFGLLVIAAFVDPGAVSAAVSIGLIAGWPLVVVSCGTLISGIVLGLGSKYGLLRYWWVSVKLVVNVILFALVVVVLMPAIGILEAEVQRSIDLGVPFTMMNDLAFPPIVSTSALLFAMVLSVVKPWGRTRKRAQDPAELRDRVRSSSL